MLGDRKRMRTCANPGGGFARCRSSPVQLLRHPLVDVLRNLLVTPVRSTTNSRSCQHLGEHLLGGELVLVGAARVLADGGDKLAELVVAGDPELNPAGAAADVPG
jgi:hypothetical protein